MSDRLWRNYTFVTNIANLMLDFLLKNWHIAKVVD